MYEITNYLQQPRCDGVFAKTPATPPFAVLWVVPLLLFLLYSSFNFFFLFLLHFGAFLITRIGRKISLSLSLLFGVEQREMIGRRLGKDCC